jgi:hypothetical protein
MLVLVENIYKAWKEGKVFSAIFMDVAGAFNNVHHTRLFHNMRKRHIPLEIIQWVQSFLTGRTTKLWFNSSTTESFPTRTGIPQGSPLSPILYLLYNSDLLDIPQQNELGLGFIDDIAFGVSGTTATDNSVRLEEMLSIVEDWRQKHGAHFETSKYFLIHFTRDKRKNTEAPVSVNGTQVLPATEAKYLGVIFDKALKYEAHVRKLTETGAKAAKSVAEIAKSTWGPQVKYVARLFTTVMAPKIDYGAVIWHRPNDRQMATKEQLKKITTIQRTVTKAILGCFHTTPTSALEIETDLAPPKWRLRMKILLSITRMKAAPPTNPIHKWIKSSTWATEHTRYKSNLELHYVHYPNYFRAKSETIKTHIVPP